MDSSSVILDYSDPSISQKVYVESNIGGWFFDAIINTDYSRELYITENPVEVGAALADHAYVKPVKLTMKIKMSDTSKSRVNGQFNGGSSRSVQALQVLATLQSYRIPVQVTARIGSFRNMLVQSLTVPDDYTTMNGMLCTVTLQEVFVAETATVKISADNQTTDSTNRGSQEASPVDSSILNQICGALGVSPSDIASSLKSFGF